MRRLVCISGKRFSGKDSLAALLAEAVARQGGDLVRHAFADASKRLLVAEEAARGVAVDLLRLTDDRAYKEAWRPRLTEVTVAALARDPEVFVRDVADRIAADPRPALVTDLRLRVERDHLARRFELVVVRLVRSDAARAASGWVHDPDKDGHRTETELDDPALWTVVVDNDRGPDALAERAAALAATYFADARAAT